MKMKDGKNRPRTPLDAGKEGGRQSASSVAHHITPAEWPCGVKGSTPSVHAPAPLPQPLSHFISSSGFVVPTVDTFAGGASITGPSLPHGALAPSQYFAAALCSTPGAKKTDGRRAMDSHTVMSSVPLRDKGVVRHVAPPGRTRIRRPLKRHGVAFSASCDCSPRMAQGIASSREKVRWHVRYGAATGGTVHHHRGRQAWEGGLATAILVS